MLGKVLPAVSFVVFACACQAVLGDFTVEPPPTEGPPPVLGAVCEPEEYRCTGSVLERCADDRGSFVPVETCANAQECNLNAKACRPCVEGEFMCRGADLERCVNSTWQYEDTCETPALCTAGADLRSGNCAMPACSVGGHQCTGPQLLGCSAGRDGTVFVELCGTNELCDTAHADALVASGLPARCLPAECARGSFRCEDGTLKLCGPDRLNWIDRGPCDSADACSATLGACGPCTPDEIECNGAELRRCTADGVWETLDTCEAAGLCDPDEGACLEAECSEPGAFRCGDTPVLERCSDDLLWEEFQACASEELCSASAGRCLTPACALGETRCRGGQFERCSGDRTRWAVQATCAADQICDAELGCIQGNCTGDMPRCNGSSLERCVGGRIEVVQRCATASLCNETAETCTPPVCGPGPEFDCDGRITSRCRPGRDDFDDFFTCPQGTLCDNPVGTGRSECDVCTPGTFQCNPESTALLRCSSDGLEWEVVQGCPTGCMVTGSDMPMCD